MQDPDEQIGPEGYGYELKGSYGRGGYGRHDSSERLAGECTWFGFRVCNTTPTGSMRTLVYDEGGSSMMSWWAQHQIPHV
jgi:hypothetical protein